MEGFQSCPICGKEHIPATRPQCPQCNADLACFQVLETLVPAHGQREKMGWLQKISGIAILTSIILFSGWLAFRNQQIEKQNIRMSQLLMHNRKEMQEYQKSLDSYQEKVEEYHQAIESLKEDIASSKEKTGEQEFFWYETSDTDTLWNISETFYKHGRYYPVLLTMNPQINIYEIERGQRLKILRNQQDVINIYNRHVVKKNLVTYFFYQIREGDTFEGLSKKFYKTEDQSHLIQQENPNMKFEPGQIITIMLKE